MSFGGNDSRGLSIPDYDIRIRSNCDFAFLWINTENFRRICGSYSNESLWIQESGNDAFFPHNGHAIFDSVDAIRDFWEIVFAQLFLFFVESAVVAACGLQVVTKFGFRKEIFRNELEKEEITQNIPKMLVMNSGGVISKI